MILLLYTLLFITVTGAKDLITTPNQLFLVPNGISAGESVKTEQGWFILPEITEEVGLSLTPPTRLISVKPSIGAPGENISITIERPKKLAQLGTLAVKVVALGLITGEEQEVPIQVVVEKSQQNGDTKTAKSATEREPVRRKPAKVPVAQAVRKVTSVNEKQQEQSQVTGPMFEKRVFKLTLDSDMAEPELAVVKLLNTDEEADHFNYKLVGDSADLFSINNQGNTVYIRSKECQQCNIGEQISLALLVSDGKRSDTALLLFDNKNAGSRVRFTESLYTTSVEEGSPTMSRLVRLNAKGGDEKNRLYSLQDASGLFALHPKTGILSLQHPEFLMAEIFGSQVNLTATVTDGHSSDTARISIDIIGKGEFGDSPKFDQEEYNFVVNPGDKAVGRLGLLAKIPGAKFSISEGSDLFKIDKISGEIEYIGPVEKETKQHTIRILAKSGEANPMVDLTTATVTVRGIGSYAPQFLRNRNPVTTMIITAPASTSVFNFTGADKDEGSVLQYGVESVHGIDFDGQKVALSTDQFSFKNGGRSNGELVLTTPLAQNELLSLNVLVSLKDMTHLNEPRDQANLTILLADVQSGLKMPPLELNENNVTVSIADNAAPGSYVYTVTVHPRRWQGQLLESMFSLAPSKDIHMFDINPKTGVITTKATFRGLSTATVPVIVLNGDDTVTANIKVQILAAKDSAPMFDSEHYNFTVSENLSPGSDVGRASSEDSEGRKVANYTLEGPGVEMFDIDKKGRIRTRIELDREEISVVHLIVRATDTSGRASLLPVSVYVTNENDNKPRFSEEEYTVNIMENLPINSYIYQVRASDLDGDKLEYDLSPATEGNSNIESFLDIDHTGRITCSEPLQELEGTHQLLVTASDGAHTSSVPLTINILPTFKCTPYFKTESPDVFSVSENSDDVGSVLGQVSATVVDSKCGLQYTLWDPVKQQYTNKTDTFKINPLTGEVSTKRSLDAEESSRIPLSVAIHSASLYTVKAMEVIVKDEDDHHIQFKDEKMTARVSEVLEPGTVIARIYAVDEDDSDKVFYHLLSHIDTFAINKETGEIATKTPLDREQVPDYKIEVAATNSPSYKDSKANAKAEVILLVDDVNDNGPVFEKAEYVLLLNSETLLDQELLRVHATDPDEIVGEVAVFFRIASAIFNYHGMTRDVSDLFTLNSTTGKLRLERSVKDFLGGTFLLNISASDTSDGRGNVEYANVKLHVYDRNDVVVVELPENPVRVTEDRLETIAGILSNRTGYHVMVADVAYHLMEGRPIGEVSDVHLVFINNSTMQVVNAEKAIAVLDSKGWVNGESAPAIRQLTAAEFEKSSVLPASYAPVILLAGIFAALLVLMITVFLVLLCYYRTRYLRERRIFEDEQILAGTLNKAASRHLQQVPHILNEPKNMLMEHKSPSEFRAAEYSVQELNVTVRSEDDPANVHRKNNVDYETLS